MRTSNSIPWGWILVAFVLLGASGVINVTPVLETLAALGETFNNYFRKETP